MKSKMFRLMALGAALVFIALAAGNSGQIGWAQEWQEVRCPPTQPFTFCYLPFSLPRFIAFSPDGKLFATGRGSEVKLWDVATGREVQTISINDLRAFAFSPSGARLASVSFYRAEVELWDVDTGNLVRTLGTPGPYWHDATSVAFSPDGKTLASGTRDHTNLVKLWDVATGNLVGTLTGHTNSVTLVAFSPSGALLASGSEDQTVRLWVVGTGREVRTLSHYVRSVAFSPDGKLLASGSWGDIKLWDVATGNLVRTFTVRVEGYSVAFSPDGRLLAANSCGLWDRYGICDAGEIKLWDVDTGDLVRTLSHSMEVNHVAFSPDGKLLASGSQAVQEPRVKLWYVGDLTGSGPGAGPVGRVEGFEAGGLGIGWITGGDAPWRVVSDERRSGSFSARAGTIGNNRRTYLEITAQVPSGEISFWLKVSSESGCDFLRFYVDGSEQGRWSGEVGWRKASYSVSAGVHTFRWEYAKDGSATSGADAAWVDDITFP